MKISLLYLISALVILYSVNCESTNADDNFIQIQDDANVVFASVDSSKSYIGLQFKKKEMKKKISYIELCRKRRFPWFSDCTSRKYSTVMDDAEFNSADLKDGRHYIIRALHGSTKLAKTKKFKLLKVGRLKSDPNLIITDVDLKLKTKSVIFNLMINQDKAKNKYSSKQYKFVLYDAITAGRLSTVRTSVNDKLNGQNKFSVEFQYAPGKHKRFYMEVFGPRSWWFGRRSLLYRFAPNMQFAFSEPHDLLIGFRGSAFNKWKGSKKHVSFSTKKSFGTQTNHYISAAPFNMGIFQPEPQYHSLVPYWVDAYAHRRSIDDQSIPNALKYLYPGEYLDDHVVYHSLLVWFQKQPMDIQESIHIIDPALVAADISAHASQMNVYPSHKRYHVVPYRVLSRNHWILVIFDAMQTRYLIVDSLPLSSKKRYGDEILTLATYLGNYARLGERVPFSTGPLSGPRTNRRISNNDPSWDLVKLWECPVNQQTDGYNCGIYTIMNTIYIFENELAEKLWEKPEQCFARFGVNQANEMREKIFVSLGSRCQYVDMNMNFPWCLGTVG